MSDRTAEVLPLRSGLDAFIAERRVARKEQLAMHRALQEGRDEPEQLGLDLGNPHVLPLDRTGDC